MADALDLLGTIYQLQLQWYEPSPYPHPAAALYASLDEQKQLTRLIAN